MVTVTADTGRGDFGVQYTGVVHDDSSDFSVLYWEELSVSEKFMGGFIGFIQLLLSRVLR